METPAETVEEILTREASENERLVEEFRKTYKGRILGTTIRTERVWLDGGEYYDVLCATVWDQGQEKTLNVCSNGASSFRYQPLNLPTLDVDVDPVVEAEVMAHRDHLRREQIRIQERTEATTVRREKFCLATTGKNAGTLGRVFTISDGQWGPRAGLATSSATTPVVKHGRSYQAAVDVAWIAPNHLKVLLQKTPQGKDAQDLLYKFAKDVVAHCGSELWEEFPQMWAWATEQPWRLAVCAVMATKPKGVTLGVKGICDAIEKQPLVVRVLKEVAKTYTSADNEYLLQGIRAVVGTPDPGKGQKS